MKRFSLPGLTVLFGFALPAFAVQSSLRFEAAFIKPWKPVVGSFAGAGCRGWDNPSFRSTGPLQIGLGRCRFVGSSLVGLIKDLFGAKQEHFSVGGLSAWMDYGGDRFVIEGEAEEAMHATTEQLLEMMRTFVLERFHLRFHYEKKVVQGFNLVVAKNGPKWTPLSDSEPRTPGFGGRGELTGQTDPARLALQISSALGVPVSDRTGLSDRFVVNLQWSPQRTDPHFTDTDADTGGPSLFTVLQEQLGLQLVPAKIPVDVFVIDSAERPTDLN